ncbi:unnamed protein product [Malus baccata var. baccata]
MIAESYVDGAWLKDLSLDGIGIAIRDSQGKCRLLPLASLKMFSPLQIEALAVREGLELVTMELETKSSILTLDLLFTWITASHIRRQANSVAHRLARFTLHSGGDCTWIDDPPSIISDLTVEEESYSCTV